MNFTIKGPTVNVPEKISIRKPLLIVGSCFAENIGNIMQQQLFDVQVNPFGIVYNPLSIASQLQMIVTRKEFEQSDLFQHNELWHSWHHHGSFSNANTTSVLATINKEIQDAHRQLLKADWLVITLGTAFYYTLPNQIIVSNCHKVPASQFNKKIATQAQITDALQEVFEHIKILNPSIKILMNVSPVRYVRDGLRENTISKSLLHLSCDELLQNNSNCFYFPSYEIVIDELRDYRFYKADMVHPNEMAIAYIYEKFAAALFDEATKIVVKEVQQFNAFSNHKILNKSEEAIAQYEVKKKEIMDDLFEKYPFLIRRFKKLKS
jgi:hypothetical protein